MIRGFKLSGFGEEDVDPIRAKLSLEIEKMSTAVPASSTV